MLPEELSSVNAPNCVSCLCCIVITQFNQSKLLHGVIKNGVQAVILIKIIPDRYMPLIYEQIYSEKNLCILKNAQPIIQF